MLARMVWRDLRRRPATTISLTVLVALSVLLASASVGLLATVGGAADRLLDAADSPHVVQMHGGDLDEAVVAEWVAGRDDLVAWQIVPLLTLDGARLTLDQRVQTDSIQQNSLMVPMPERDLLLTLGGAPLTQVDAGTVWLPVFYAIEDGLAVGDTVAVTGTDGFAKDLVVAGFHRDPIMNTALASSKRLAVNEGDYVAIAPHTGATEYLLEFWLVDPSQMAAFTAAYLGAGLPSQGPSVDRATFRLLTMIGEGLEAGVVILAAVLLLIVGLGCLRLSVLTAIQQDLREIGVLKAIGVPTRAVGLMQLAKYGAIAATACLLGLAGGLALLPLMTRSLTAYMGPSGSMATWAAPVVVAVGVFGLVLLFIVAMLRRIGRISAVEALQSSAADSRWRGPRLGLHRAKSGPVAMRLGLIQLLRRWRTSALLGVVFAVAIFIVVVPLSAALTIRSPSFTSYMGIPHSDLRIDLPSSSVGAQTLPEVISALAADPSVEQLVAHTAIRAETTDADGLPLAVFVENGDHRRIPLSYADGRAPQVADEIALSLVTMADTGAAVGDVISVRSGDLVREVTIVGSYQDVTNGGRTGRAMLPTEGADVVWHVISIDLAGSVDLQREAERIAAMLPDGRVNPIDAYRTQTLGPVIERIGVTAVLAGVVALLLAALVTVMTTRMILASDAGQIAIQRAIGMPDKSIRAQYVTQVLATLVVAVPLGVLGAATLGQGMFNLLFEGLYGGFEMLGRGTSRIEFASEPLLTLVALPLALALVVGTATVAACHDIKTVGIRTVIPE